MSVQTFTIESILIKQSTKSALDKMELDSISFIHSLNKEWRCFKHDFK